MSVPTVCRNQHSSYYSLVNHKPNLSNGTRTTKLSRSSNGEATLSIKDNEDGNISRYAYKGQRNSFKNSYVLIFDPETQSCTLEPVKSAYNFNLTSTPWETSKEKLARDYEQLDGKEEVNQGSVDKDPDGEPDADNPFDFRHFLSLNSRPSTSPSPPLKHTSTAHTPSLASSRPSASTSKPTHSRPASKVDPLRQVPRKSKPAQAEKKADPKPTPTVRLDRRASTRPNEQAGKTASKSVPKPAGKSTAKSDYYVHSSDDEDSPPLPQASQSQEEKSIDAEESGGLEIDWGNDRPKPRRAPPSRTLDLPDLGGDGPISLHSAANSPAGRMAIPRKQQKRRQEYEADVIDFGTSDAYVSDDDVPQKNDRNEDEDTQMQDMGQGESDADGDDDVEPMDLGSPAHHQPQQPVPLHQDPLPDVPEDEVDYDDDDLEAQMLAAMEDEDEEQPVAVADDESDVSEAE